MTVSSYPAVKFPQLIDAARALQIPFNRDISAYELTQKIWNVVVRDNGAASKIKLIDKLTVRVTGSNEGFAALIKEINDIRRRVSAIDQLAERGFYSTGTDGRFAILPGSDEVWNIYDVTERGAVLLESITAEGNRHTKRMGALAFLQHARQVTQV